MPQSIAVFTKTPELLTQATALAQRLHLPLADNVIHYDYLLILTPDYLGIKKTGTTALPFYVDFLAGKLNYRRQHTSLRREMLARALGLKNKTTPFIVDATAGLARDSFILACLGFEVTLLERSPLIHALVEDGIQRASQQMHAAPIVQRLHLIKTDANAWLRKLTPPERPHMIYLDPMFPERTKTALVKKDMQIFHDIVGKDNDADTLLQTALACATQRVVVKRPRLAALLEPAPNFSLTGSSSRFDVYLV